MRLLPHASGAYALRLPDGRLLCENATDATLRATVGRRKMGLRKAGAGVAGGGLFATNSTLNLDTVTMTQCVVGNLDSADDSRGGGLFAVDCTLAPLNNCTFTGNTVQGINRAAGAGVAIGSPTSSSIRWRYGSGVSARPWKMGSAMPVAFWSAMRARSRSGYVW